MTRTISSTLVCGAVLVMLSQPAHAQREGSRNLDIGLGGGLGVAYIGDDTYLNIAAQVSLRLWAFQTALEGSFNLDMDDWDLRAEDWDEGRDYMRIVNCARFDMGWEYDPETGGHDRIDIADYPMLTETGGCEAWPISARGRYLSVRLAPLEDITLGTGHVMRGYTNFLDVDHYTLGLVGEFQSNVTVGGTVLLADITRGDVMGGRIYYRPLWSHSGDGYGDSTVHELEIGATLVTDLGAPTETATAFGGARIVDHERNLIYETDAVMVVGLDLHYRYQLREEWFIGANAEYGFIWDSGRDTSEQVGNMGGHVSFGFFWEPPVRPVTLDFFAEYRMVGSSYIPEYFDSFYSVQRAQYALSPGQRDRIDPTLTKLGYLRALAEEDSSLEHSYNAVFHFDLWRWYTAADGQRRLARFLRTYLFVDQIVGRPSSGTWGILLVMPNLFDHVTLAGLYARTGFNDASDFFSLDGSLIRAFGRYNRIWRGLYLELSYYYRFRLDPASGYYDGAHDFVFNLGWDYEAL